MDEVFRALDDPSRRLLLDRLFDEDGQTLGALCAHLPSMTRYGVMNHLRVLEAAGLVTTRRVGRSKHHYLNPVPIRLVHDRWISKYTEPTVHRITGLKAHLEGEPTMTNPDHVYQAFIRATPDAVFDAIVDGDATVRYFYGTRVESSWQPGRPVAYTYPDGSVAADGEVIAFERPHRVEMTFVPRWDPELEAEGAVREVWKIDPADGYCVLTVEMYDMPAGSKTYDDFVSGIPFIVSGLKTLVETGTPLAAPR